MFPFRAVVALVPLVLGPPAQASDPASGPASAPAQGAISHVPGATLQGAGNEMFSRRVSRAGDVNADGFNDLIVESLVNDAGVLEGVARVVSGLDATTLASFEGLGNHPFDGLPAAGAGDVDGDGHADLIVGNADANTASVTSGKTGAILFTFLGDAPDDGFGGAVAAAGDVDGDGRPDVIVGTVGGIGALSGYARVFSGADGAMLLEFHEESAGDRFGTAVAGAGDVNGDGHADLVVGAYNDGHDVLNPGFPPFVPPFWTEDSAGAVSVYSGADGAMLWTAYGDVELDGLGWSVASAGDVNGDGFDDVIAGCRSIDNPPAPAYARVFSGVDGSTLMTLQAGQQPVFVAVSGAGDLDGDGVPDLLDGGRGSLGTSAARVHSGADGSVLFSYEPQFAWTVSVAGLGDLNADGIADFVVGAPEDILGGGLAQVFVSQGAPAAASVYGCGVNPAGSLQVLSGLPALGQTMTLGLNDPTAGFPVPASVLLLVSSQPDPAFPCGTFKPNWGLAGPGTGGELLVGVAPPDPLLVWPAGTFTGSMLEVPLTVPTIAGIVGVQVFAQGVFLGPTHRIGLTDAVSLAVGAP